MIKQEIQVSEIVGVKEYLDKGYTLYYGVTKNNKATLLVGKDNVYMPYDIEQRQFILTGIKRIK